jgi:hypothetical protein
MNKDGGAGEECAPRADAGSELEKQSIELIKDNLFQLLRIEYVHLS